MQKKSVKKNRRHANQTRRRKSIMRGGNNTHKAYFAILIALLALKMLNNYYSEPPVHRETETASFAAPSAAHSFAASSAAPSAAAALSAELSARINRYPWNEDTKLSNRQSRFGEDGPERNSKIHAMQFQDATHRIINNQAMSVADKLLALRTFFDVITESNYPTQIAQTNTIMSFCMNNENSCKKLLIKYSWFKDYMKRFLEIHDETVVVSSSKTCDNNDINRILSRIISEKNVVNLDNPLDKVAKEIAFATASNLVKKDSARTKAEIKRKEEKKNRMTTNIFGQMQTCGYYADTDNYFRLNNNCCFTEPELYKGGLVSGITINKKGKIVDTNNVDETDLNAAIEIVKKTIDLESLTTEQLMKEINKITTKNNITISENKNEFNIRTH